MGPSCADTRIDELAARQYGVVSRTQLLTAGVSANAIDHRLRKGRLRRVHRGVYHAGPITGRYQAEMAAVLGCGPGAALSDRTAAGLWGMLPSNPEAPVDVVGPRSLRGPASGVRLHRRGSLPDDEVAERHGLPLTTPARTVIDLASGIGSYELERALAGALRRDIVAVDAIEVLLTRYPRRKGYRTLRSLLDDARGPMLTRSEAEARFLALLRRGGLDRPRTNAVVNGLEVDFFWPDRGVVVEVDGFAFHSNRTAFEHDRDRGTLLSAKGNVVLRFTWRQITKEPEKVLVRISLTLGSRTGSSG